MKRDTLLTPLHWLMMAVWGVFVLLLTMLPGHVPLVRVLAGAIGGTETSAVLGHIALFALLTLFTWRALVTWFHWRQAIIMALAAGLLLGTTTELFQWFVSSRDATITDLLANWLGVFASAFVITWFAASARR